MWVPTWSPWEVILRATVVYVVVQFLFRNIGSKELGRYAPHQLAMFVLIAVAARQAIVGPDASLTSAIMGLTTLATLEWLLSYLSFRSRRFARWVEGPVCQLIRDGQLQETVLQRTRISREDILAELRKRGVGRLTNVKDAFLERSGAITFIFWADPQRFPRGPSAWHDSSR
jgi:uncharacterized membrane protein YcaP (DUF421 family)